MISIWKKYFFKELAKLFFLFITSFYFLYVLIDFSTHTKVFYSGDMTWLNGIYYYLFQFTKRADVLVPFALLVGVIKVLTVSNIRNELMALTTGGIPIKKILSPFIGMAALCSLFLYLNFQIFQPAALHWIDRFEERYFRGKNLSDENSVKALQVEDNSLLIYQRYDHESHCFLDVYWLKNNQTIYRIQALYPEEVDPKGEWVDLLERNSSGEIVKTATYERLSFPGIKIDPKLLFHAIYPPQMQSLSQLAHTLNWRHTLQLRKMSDREAEIATFFLFKLTFPLICFLAVLGPAPFCMRTTRHLGVFLIFALSLFALIGIVTVVKSCLILAENQVLPPLLALVLPQMTFFLLLIFKYAKR